MVEVAEEQSVGDEPGAVAAHHGRLAEPLRQGHDVIDHVVLRDDRAHDLHQRLEGCRVEELHADDLLGASGADRDLRHRQGGGLGAEDRVVREDLVQPAQHRDLGLEVLRQRLDHQLAAGETRQVGAHGDARQQRGTLVGGHLLAVDRALRGRLDGREPARGGRVLDVDAHHLDAVPGEHLGDARAHGAETDDADAGELPGHARSLARRQDALPVTFATRARAVRTVTSRPVRLVVARCQVDYTGRLSAHLPPATRLLMVKADGSVSVHADDRAYKPLNWMSPPCRLREDVDGDGVARWTVSNPAGETLQIVLLEVLHDSRHELGPDPGLRKDGVELHLQALLAEHVATLGEGWRLVRREYPTPIGSVDLLCRDAAGATVAVEVKRRGEIDGVEQLTRYLELLNRDPRLAPVRGVLAAQEIKPQARTLAGDRGIACLVLDYDALRGRDDPDARLF
jgi:RecB family endonuclease NucS